MSFSLPQRGPITDLVIAALQELASAPSPVLVGDAVKPAGGGWPGEAQEEDFAAYTVVGTAPARRKPGEPDSLRQGHTSWLMVYTLTSYGAARAQADWCADQVRAAAIALTGVQVVAGETWLIRLAFFENLAPVTVNTQDDPPTYTITDQLTLDITRSTR